MPNNETIIAAKRPFSSAESVTGNSQPVLRIPEAATATHVPEGPFLSPRMPADEPSPGDRFHSLRDLMSRRMASRKRIVQGLFFTLFRGAVLVTGLALAVVIYFLIRNGIGAINWTFLSSPPLDSMTRGGILPCIVGTFVLGFGAMLVSLPIGIISAIYLSEYAREGTFLRLIRLGINNLAGVPSVVFGLFGQAFFVIYLNFGMSILSGSLTLGVMILPVIISTAEEALRNVPRSYREASLALGATRWQTVLRVVLPAALANILTGAVLGLSRAVGETAPIMFTAAVFYTPKLPQSIFDEVMALPYHIYVLATAGTNIEQTRPLQYGTALVLIAMVLGMNLGAIIYRSRLRRQRFT